MNQHDELAYVIYDAAEAADYDEGWHHRSADAVLAADYHQCHEEWGIRYERTADPTMDNPSGEVTKTIWLPDEAAARLAVYRKVPLGTRNRRVVRRYVTEPEEA